VKRVVVVVGIAMVCAVAAHFLWPISATRIPSTVSVNGHQVTISRVHTLSDGQVSVTLLVHPVEGWGLSMVGPTRIKNGRSVQRRWVKTDLDGTVHAEIVFTPTDESFGEASIEQELPFHRAGKLVTWQFKDINPAKMPVQVRNAGVDLELRGVSVNAPVVSNRSRGRHSYRWICRQVDRAGRPDGRRYGLEIGVPTPDGRTVMWGCALRANGRDYTSSGVYFDRFFEGAQTARAMGGSTDPNLTELVIGKINEEAGAHLYEKRLSEARNRHEREVLLFAFPEIDPPPKRFDLTVTGSVPVPGQETVMVRFDKVPLPKAPAPSPPTASPDHR
jgi:hypothetical protein